MDGQVLKQAQPLSTPPPNEPAIQRWLIARVAAIASCAEADIDVGAPFSHYALDSLAAVGLSGELEDWLGAALPPTLFWDYPSIESLARHLAALGRP